MKILSADIIRDGGSYEAILDLDGQIIALWLQAGPWDRVEDREYENLYVSNGTSAFVKERKIEIGGVEEKHWVDLLNRGLQTLGSANDTGCLREMAAVLERRCTLADQWLQLKESLPIGARLHGTVASVQPFGVFVHLGVDIVDDYRLSGIIDIATKADHDSFGLPRDRSQWPKVGDVICCKVVHYRESAMEIDLRLADAA